MKLLNLYDIQRYVKACAAKANLNVVYEDTKVPYCTPGCVHLPDITAYTTEEELASYLYFIEHETAHATHSDFDALRGLKKGTITQRVTNILEDYRVDTLEAQDYDGFRQNRSEVVPREIENVRKSFEGLASNHAAKPEAIVAAEKLMSAVAWVSMHDDDGIVANAGESLIVNDNIRQWVDKLNPYSDHLDALLDGESSDAKELAIRIVKEVFEEDPSQDEEPQQGEDGSGGKGKDGEGKGEGEGKEEGEPKDGEGEGGDDGFGNHFDHKTGVPQGRVLKHDYKPQVTRRIKITRGSGTFRLCLQDDYIIVPLHEGYPSVARLLESELGPNNKKYAESTQSQCVKEVKSLSSGTVEGFAQQVRRLLQIRARSRYEYGQKRGKIDQSRLARIGMRDAPGFNDRIFKNKIVADTVNTAVTVLLDASGSMSGSKWQHAVKSAQLLNATVANALGIPLEILAFTDAGNASVIYEGKTFNQLRVSDDDIVNRLSWAACSMSGNADGEAVLYAYDRLRVRREKRKVMIVVSDGAPACDRPGDIDKLTLDVINSIEAAKLVDIYGLGLMSHSVDQFYTRTVIVNYGDSLEAAILKLIDRAIA